MNQSSLTIRPCSLFLTLVLPLAGFLLTNRAVSQIVNLGFDDLPGTGVVSGFAGTPIPSVYSGLNWNNFWALNTGWYTATYAPGGSGYLHGTVSTPNVAYMAPLDTTSYGGTFSISGGAFNLLSADLTAAWYNGLNVEVFGYKGGTLMYDNTYVINTTGPSLINFNYLDITSVKIVSSGGVLAYPVGTGVHGVALDNVTVDLNPPSGPPSAVPEPSTYAVIGGLGLFGLIARRHRGLRRRTAACEQAAPLLRT